MIARKGIAGGHRLQSEEDVEFLWCNSLKVPVPAHYICRFRQLKEDRPAINEARGVGLEKETGDDAKISTTAAQSPEEVGVVRLASGSECAVRQHQIDLDQIVNGEPILAAEIAVAAAEGQTRNACGRNNAERDGKSECMGSVVNIARLASSAYPHSSVGRIDAHTLHHRQVDDEAIVDAAKSGAVMAAAADGDGKLVGATEIHCCNDVGGIDAAGDHQAVACRSCHCKACVLHRNRDRRVGLECPGGLAEFRGDLVVHDVLP